MRRSPFEPLEPLEPVEPAPPLSQTIKKQHTPRTLKAGMGLRNSSPLSSPLEKGRAKGAGWILAAV